MLSWVKTREDTARNHEALLESLEDASERISGLALSATPPKATNADILAIYPYGDPHVGMYAWREDAQERNREALFQQLTAYPHIFRFFGVSSYPHYLDLGRLLPFTEPFEAQAIPMAVAGSKQAFLPVPKTISLRGATAGIHPLALIQRDNIARLCRVYVLEYSGAFSIAIENLFAVIETTTPIGIGIIYGDNETTRFRVEDGLVVKNPTLSKLPLLEERINGAMVDNMIEVEPVLEKGSNRPKSR